MNGSDAPRRTSYLLSIWHEEQEEAQVWHGFIETAAQQRLDFSTLAELNRLLCELGGWMDPPLSLHQKSVFPRHGMIG
jgi:hypothetical protein